MSQQMEAERTRSRQSGVFRRCLETRVCVGRLGSRKRKHVIAGRLRLSSSARCVRVCIVGCCCQTSASICCNEAFGRH
eukprot:3069599-Lingulodinium_polyedra.AAC.1